MTAVVADRTGLRTALDQLVPGTKRAVVLTMGALHDGHARLVREARARVGPQGHVTVTVFVNPLQFGPEEDLDKYPRTLDDDVELCRREAVDLVFAPTYDVVYSGGDPMVRIDPGPLARILEGAARPGHFAGVLTVVAKLLALTGPDLTVFGEKDYQQLALVRRMAVDLDLGVHIVGAPIVRDGDGLALSSRNAYLSPTQRAAAVVVPRSLEAGQHAARRGMSGPQVAALVAQTISQQPDASVDYAVVTDPLLGPAPESGEARLLVAVRLGPVRLLDNISLTLTGPG